MKKKKKITSDSRKQGMAVFFAIHNKGTKARVLAKLASKSRMNISLALL